MMSRKSLWLGFMLAIFAAAMLTLPASAKPKKKKIERRSGPPTISLMAEPAVIKACADEGRVQLTTNGHSESGRLRYRWSVNGGRLRGDGPSPMWELGGVAPGVYQAIVDVDDGDANCVAFSSISIVVLDCPPPPPEKPVDRKSTRLNSSHLVISYAVFCLKKKKLLHDADSLVARACTLATKGYRLSYTL